MLCGEGVGPPSFVSQVLCGEICGISARKLVMLQYYSLMQVIIFLLPKNLITDGSDKLYVPLFKDYRYILRAKMGDKFRMIYIFSKLRV
jgi:hypothetical protein